ncbi:amino acid ABC transporter permease [Candidatus Liberibacter americanus]|uniref:amino acid ABC transporter permease n=1 Tax=Candidatus Liberibacter americanus TaxID=309868 RepID=UPI001651128F|nr:amino acid ABC transporter permease [Candidatus Liberibacter americanus]
MPEWLNLVIDSFPQLFYATVVFTIPIALISFVLSLIIGLFLAIAWIFFTRKVTFIIYIYVWIFRGTPLLAQLFLIFYGLPHIGIVVSAFNAVVIILTLNFSAYISEVIRSSIMAISRGQWEASYSIGLTLYQTMRHVILPQAAATSIAPLSSEFISILKSTSLASSVTVPELFQISNRIVSTTFQPLIIYLEIVIIYLVLTSLCYLIQIKLESFFTRYTCPDNYRKKMSLKKEKQNFFWLSS